MKKNQCSRPNLQCILATGKKQLATLAAAALLGTASITTAQETTITTTPVQLNSTMSRVPAGQNGWAYNSVNGVVFRKNSLATFGDTQYTAFYDSAKNVVLGKRKIGTSTWTLRTTQYTGNTNDAHNCISIIVDGAGYLHVSWDHHNNTLHYARATAPGSLILGNQTAMIGSNETSVTYPEFYTLPSGDLIFMYRDGASGNGNTVMNRYSINNRSWTRVQTNLISGEGARNAYTQSTIDRFGYIHVSWVWRESSNVSSNHDMNYAVSYDGGVSWKKSTGAAYSIPIVLSTAEKIATIPQNSDLINQTSITTDEDGRPYIASYWKDASDVAPQYHIIYKAANGSWTVDNLGFRTQNFSLAGIGTQVIPISRPQLLVWKRGAYVKAVLVFRDVERNKKLSLATNDSLGAAAWRLIDAGNDPIGDWEPSFDTEIWRTARKIHIFGQYMLQGANETTTSTPPQPVFVLEVDTAVRGNIAVGNTTPAPTSPYGSWSGSEVLGQQYLPNRSSRATSLGSVDFNSASSGTGVTAIANNGKVTTSTTTTEYYIPKTDTGSAVARLQAYANPAFTYRSDSVLFMRQSTSANVNKFSIHNLTSSATASLKMDIRFSTTSSSNAAATYALSIGRESGSGSYDNNTASISSSTNINGMFTALRWVLTSSGSITLSYRTSATAYTNVSTLTTDTNQATWYKPFTFAKNTAYTLKVWCNNTASITGYYVVQGRKYQVAPATYDVWVNNQKIVSGLPSLRKVTNSAGVASGDAGASINAFAIEGATSGGTLNEYIRMSNIEWKAAINNTTTSAKTATANATATAAKAEAVTIEKSDRQEVSLFTVYPTLLQGETINVRFGKLAGQAEVRLVSVDGKTLLRKEVPATYSYQTLALQTGRLQPGAYVLLVNDGKTTQNVRMVKQ